MIFAFLTAMACMSLRQESAELTIPSMHQAVMRVSLPARPALKIDVSLNNAPVLTFRGGDTARVLFVALPNKSKASQPLKIQAEIAGLVGKPAPLKVVAGKAGGGYLVTIGEKSLSAEIKITDLDLGQDADEAEALVAMVNEALNLPVVARPQSDNVPLLGSLPIIGELFRKSGENKVPPP
jgi:hypothetical protein